MRTWLSGLPTEFQLALVFGLFMLLVFFLSPVHPVYEKNLSSVLTALSSLALGALAHGVGSRWGKPDGAKDLMGDTK